MTQPHRESVAWEQTYVRLRRNRERRLARLRQFDLPLDGRVLDYGCGDGLNLELLHSLGCTNLIGFDVSEQLLGAVKNYRVAAADGLQTPFAAGSFDAVVVDSVLHHLDLDPALAEIHRLLRPGGRLCVVEPGGGLARRLLDAVTFSPLARFLRMLRDRRQSVTEELETYQRWLQLEKKVPSLLAAQGFTLLRMRRIPLNLFLEAIRNDN